MNVHVILNTGDNFNNFYIVYDFVESRIGTDLDRRNGTQLFHAPFLRFIRIPIRIHVCLIMPVPRRVYFTDVHYK